jgi:protein-S-isoprenylcysteine O-methyltransferase Ste14
VTAVEAFVVLPAVLFGAACLSAPVVLVFRNARRAGGRASGAGAVTGSRPFVLLAGALFLGAGILLWKPLPVHLSEPAAAGLSILGAALYFPGTSLYLWSLAALGPQFGVSSVSGARLYRDHRLVTQGPFGIVRHPMYIGVLLAAAGALLIFRTWAMLVFAPMSLVVAVRAEREEQLLAETFGDSWKAYCSRVPKWLPRLR